MDNSQTKSSVPPDISQCVRAASLVVCLRDQRLGRAVEMGEFLCSHADDRTVGVLLFLPVEPGCLSLVPVLGQTPPGLVEEQHPAATLEDGPEHAHSSHSTLLGT